MGLTQNLGRLSPSIFSDASLNIGVGAAPSGSYKFEVTGTSKVSGVLTLGSTISNGTYTYTLPAATGTLALVGGAGVGTVTSVAATGGTGISITGSPITTSGTITITNTAPDQTVALTASTGISVTGTYPNFTITNTSPSSGGTVTSVAALTLGTTGTDLSSSVATGTTTPVITLNVPTASAANRGALSSADWTTFNNKQSALTNPVTGTGTTNYLPKFTGTSTIGNSVIQESSNLIGIGMTPFSGYKLNVSGLQKNEGANTTLNFGELDANNIYFQALNLAGNASKGFVWYGTGEYMRIWGSTGNVNIGTTPASDSGYKLDVNGTGRFTGDLSILKSSGYATITTDATDGVNFIFKQGGVTKHEIYTNSTKFAIYNSTTAAIALEIANATGAATFSSSVTASLIGGTTTVRVSHNEVAAFDSSSVTSLYLNYGGGNVLMNSLGGNVLIGTTTDDTSGKLQVNGFAKATSYYSINSTVSVPALGTATVLTLSSTAVGVYIINANFGGQGNAVYGSTLIVVANTNNFRIVTNGSGASAALTLSGANVQITNALGVGLDAAATAILIGNL